MTRLRALYRRLRYGATPFFHVSELPDNTFGKIAGVVESLDGEQLSAPMSSRPCVYYSVVVDVYWSEFDGREIGKEERGVPFVLRDGEHRAVIDPTHAKISIRYDHTTESRGMTDAHPHHRALLERHQLDGRNWGTNTLRYNEAVLQVGQRITVIGSGVQELDPSAPEARKLYRERGPTRLRMMGAPSTPLLISDRSRRT